MLRTPSTHLHARDPWGPEYLMAGQAQKDQSGMHLPAVACTPITRTCSGMYSHHPYLQWHAPTAGWRQGMACSACCARH